MTGTQSIEMSARIEGLVSRARNGDRGACALLYQEYVSPIYRYTYLRVGQAGLAEDLTQEVFLRALQSIGSYRWKGKPFVSWLFRIAHNLIIDHYRRAKRDSFIPLNEGIVAVADTDPVATAEQRMELSELKRAIGKLPPREKEAISLRFGAELSIAETARVTGKTEGSVKKLQHEALVKLRKLMEK